MTRCRLKKAGEVAQVQVQSQSHNLIQTENAGEVAQVQAQVQSHDQMQTKEGR